MPATDLKQSGINNERTHDAHALLAYKTIMKQSNNSLEDQILDYLDGRLSEDAENAFEERLMSDPELATQVYDFKAMQLALQQTDTVTSRSKGTQSRPFSQWKTVPTPLALAATVAGLLIGANLSTQTPITAPIELAHFNTVSTRGDNAPQGALLQLDAKAGAQATLLLISEVRYPQYRAKLFASGESLESTAWWQSEHFEPGPLKEYLLQLPAVSESQAANLKVYAISANGEEIAVPFCHFSEGC